MMAVKSGRAIRFPKEKFVLQVVVPLVLGELMWMMPMMK